MTAEVVIMNKQCIALAADSIVTVTSRLGEKTYDTGNKLWTLSKYEPVGVLTYGSTEIHTVPVDVIVKEGRDLLGKRKLASLKAYSDYLIRYIRTKLPRTKEDDERNFTFIIRNHFRSLRERFNSECQRKKIPIDQRRLSSGGGKKIFDDALAGFISGTKRAGKAPSLQGITRAKIAKQYDATIKRQFQAEFGRYSPTSARQREIMDAVIDAILSKKMSDQSCGLVIAGYGSDELYPSITWHDVEGFIAGKLKIVSGPIQSIRTGNESDIYGFAQRDAALLFMRGIDPNLERHMHAQLRRTIPGIADTASRYITDKSKVPVLRRRLTKLADDFIQRLEQKSYNDFTRKITDAVDLLDKPELATFAENLVRLTALRQKVSLEIETVGGEIDVAIISKHDGFIWIKRKHYFDRELNPFFEQKYLVERQ